MSEQQHSAEQYSVFPGHSPGMSPPESSRDPIRIMIEIAENDKLSEAEKSALIQLAQTRFTNRRRIAYIALYGIIISLALLFIAAFIDRFTICTAGQECHLLKSIKNGEALFIWIEGFLAAIVAAYYGFSAWRPAS
jgi:hypothetical protein